MIAQVVPNCTLSGATKFLEISYPYVAWEETLMLCLPYWLLPARQGEAKSLLLLANAEVQPGREQLQPLLIGSIEGVRGAISHLHLLRYAEQREQSRLMTILESGILITPEQGEVLSYLLQYLQLG